MGYDYNPIRQRFDMNKKRLTIVVLVVLLIIGVFFTGKTLTGYVTYSASLADELNQTKLNLSACSTQLSSTSSQLTVCQSDNTKLKSYVDMAKSSAQACATDLSIANSSLGSCKTDNENLKSQKEFFESNYNKLAENAAADICCARGITMASWSINDSFILCSGNRTVNCIA